MTSAEALAGARALGVASLDAQLLLARVLATTRTGLIANDERVLTDAEAARWSDWLARRAAGEPVAYLLGEKEFCGLVLDVRPGVLVPRPETELLVDWAAELLGGREPGATVLDLGTGSGAIGLAIKHRFAKARVTAVDASPAALGVAAANAARLGLEVEIVASSWFEALGQRRFDLIVANPPYVGVDDPHLAALRHEPIEALVSGHDGLDALGTITHSARDHLKDGGWLLLEHGFGQGAAVRTLLAEAGLAQVTTRSDLAGHERATGGLRAWAPE
ncbi:MAG: peptide chain release factor N(5)-glutamine methyltransferase [Caldimonas sp.]